MSWVLGKNAKGSDTQCIHDEFINQAVLYPQKTAVILNDKSLTYAEVLCMVRKLSVYLIEECNVKRGDVICQCVERSIEMVIGIFAIMASGCVYCPLNPADPSLRLRSLINDIHATIVIFHSQTKRKFDCMSRFNLLLVNSEQIIALDYDLKQQSLALPVRDVHVTKDDIAYCIYTSGSTGKPKAVLIQHQNLAVWIRSLLYCSIQKPTDITAQIAGCSWILHAYEIIGSLTTGATLVMLKPGGNMDVDYLSKTIESEQVTTMWLGPSMVKRLCEFLQETKQCYRLKTVQSFCTA
ncbi:unnamed protein product, partial [Didymodactylos carnosus]